MRVALVHDWLTGMRGGERVLHEFCQLFPSADLYTLIHVPGSTSESIEDRPIFESPLSLVPGAAKHYRKLLPLFPWAIQRFELKDYDLVISSSHAVAKGVRIAPGTPHLCYCYTPMRYVWDQVDAYLGTGAFRVMAWPLVAYLRNFDQATSGRRHVTQFVAISATVAERIERRYDRKAPVIFPPVDVERIQPSGRASEDFYLLVGGFVPYKREEIALEAFQNLDRTLIVAGDGPRCRELQEQYRSERIRFLGRSSDEQLADLYARCRALIYPQEEDFGIIPVEAQAAGRPVIAFGRGGASETVIPLNARSAQAATGVWFTEQTPESLRSALEFFEANESAFKSEAIRRHAEGFSNARFHSEIRAAVERLLEETSTSR